MQVVIARMQVANMHVQVVIARVQVANMHVQVGTVRVQVEFCTMHFQTCVCES